MKLSLFNNPNQPNPSRDLTIRSMGTTDHLLGKKHATKDIGEKPKDNHNIPFYDLAHGDPTPFGNTCGIIQNQILNRLYLVTGLSGMIVFASELHPLIQNSLWYAVGIVGLTLLGLIGTAFLHRKAFSLSVIVLFSSMIVLGLSTILVNQFYSIGQVFLLAIPFFAALLVGKRGRITSLVISLGVVCLIVALVTIGLMPQPDYRFESGNQYLFPLFVWIFIYSIIAIGGSVSAGSISDGLQESFERQYFQTHEMANTRALLEGDVRQRTDELQRRLVQIRTAAEINRAISRSLDIDQLFPDVCKMVSQRFGLYYVGIFLIEGLTGEASETRPQYDTDNPASEYPASSPYDFFSRATNDQSKYPAYAVLKAGSGEAGRQMLLEGHKLEVGGDSMIGWATANLKPRIAQNVGHEEVRFNNPHLPLTRSELALPILIQEGIANQDTPGHEKQGERILGAMTIQSSEEEAFDQDDILILQGIADSLASAIENTRLFAATESSLKEIRTLHSQYLAQAWRQETELRGEIAYSFQSGNTSQLPADNPLETPIRLRDQVIGILSIESGEPADPADKNQRTWSSEELAFIEAVTNQAALALENARLLEETRRKADLERTATNITSKMWASADIEKILQTALQELSQTLGACDGRIELWPGENGSQPAGDVVVDRSIAHNQMKKLTKLTQETHGSN